jgi:molybdopterin-guanine dinucleotide biosynthesis protein A
MGTDKVLLRVEGLPLLERALAALRAVFRRVHVSIDPSRPYPEIPADRIPDGSPGLGPLEGVRASLERLGAPTLFVAVDVPWISPELARALWREGTAPGRRGAVPKWAGGVEPAFALYGPELLAEIGGLLESGRRDLRQLASLRGVALLDLEEPETRARIFPGKAPPPSDLFRNLNTPADLRALEGRQRRAGLERREGREGS